MTWLLVALLAVAGFALGGLMGAPYLPTRRRDLAGIFELADLKPGQLLVELGAGTGGVMKAAARRGLRCVGYEINPWLWLVAKVRLWPHRRLAQVRLGNFWQADLDGADAVYVFLIPGKMGRLESMLAQSRPPKVISYAFQFPARKSLANRGHYWLYNFAA